MLILTSPDMKQSELLPKTSFKRRAPLPKSRKSTIVLTRDEAWGCFLWSASVQHFEIGSSIFWRHWMRMRRTAGSMKIWRGERQRNKKRYICEKWNDYRRRMNGIRQGTWRHHVYLMVHRCLTPLVNRYAAPTIKHDQMKVSAHFSTPARIQKVSQHPIHRQACHAFAFTYSVFSVQYHGSTGTFWILKSVAVLILVTGIFTSYPNSLSIALTIYPRFQQVSNHFNPQTLHSLSISVL